MSRANFSDISSLDLSTRQSATISGGIHLRQSRDRFSYRGEESSKPLSPTSYSAIVSMLAEMAAKRIGVVKQYATDFGKLIDSTITPLEIYDTRRAAAIYHSLWIFTDRGQSDGNRKGLLDPTCQRVTFRDLCGMIELNSSDCGCGVDSMSRSSGLSCDEARAAILRCFSVAAFQSLLRPVHARVFAAVVSDWMNNGPMVKGAGSGRGRPKKKRKDDIDPNGFSQIDDRKPGIIEELVLNGSRCDADIELEMN